MMAIVTTFGFSTPPDKVGQVIGIIGESRTSATPITAPPAC